ncbi:hypothetical protein K503DRAFT_199784 [Rhizopogon vinicolor AM-OR11-026]|uniref:DUF6533 domain-containing protein n=1 Tax=Rhizopogon vinicolor AM-OR11-026 TaxID=1314800 RepID=A0A1B7NES4_9AGAM|nr:hypothetical protein K503DRAFT_199784 [Rhizopogon vinicolor AM-OR11-026]
MSDKEVVTNFFWNNCSGVAIITLISYEYLLLFAKEVKYGWKRQWSLMSCLYLVVRYLGLFIVLLSGCWGRLFYMPEVVSHVLVVLIESCSLVYRYSMQAILIWRLYALYNQSKRLLYVLLSPFLPIVAIAIGSFIYLLCQRNPFSVEEITTPNARYCTFSVDARPMFAIYTSWIPTVCYDIFLVALAAAILVKHLIERRTIKFRPNTYIIMITRYHIINFVLNLAYQIVRVILWVRTDIPTPVSSLLALYTDTAPFILAPRIIIDILDSHAREECVHVSTTFANCVCWTSPPEHEMDF